jgi:hypothetical protein
MEQKKKTLGHPGRTIQSAAKPDNLECRTLYQLNTFPCNHCNWLGRFELTHVTSLSDSHFTHFCEKIACLKFHMYRAIFRTSVPSTLRRVKYRLTQIRASEKDTVSGEETSLQNENFEVFAAALLRIQYS